MKKSLAFLICIYFIFLSQLLSASKLVEVKVIDKDYLLVEFADGNVTFNENVNLANAYTNSVDNSQINSITWYGSKLSTAEAVSVANWTITSTDDSNFGATGVKPTICYRKSKINGVHCGSWNTSTNDFNYTYPLEHIIYLKLPKSLQQGKTYTINLDPKILSDLVNKSIQTDIYNNISEAIHVNLVGYINDASIKSADLYTWMGNGAGRDYSSFVGKKVYLYDVNTKTSTEVGKITFWKNNGTTDFASNNLIQSNVWNADFTGFNTPGTYRLAIEDVGCSQDFTIKNDVYYQPFMVSTRGYFYTRMNQDNMDMKPVPRRPLYIPGVSPINTTIYITTMNPLNPAWNTFTCGDPWDNNCAGWDKYVKAGNPKNTKVRGGHGDAFDFDRHLGHISSFYDMMLPYILTGGAMSDDNLGIAESGNGIPDILDEARNEVDFWLGLRDGKAYGSGLTNPNSSNILYQAGSSALAAWANAANCSMLSNCFQLAGNDDLMKTYRDSAIIAYNYAGSLADQQLDLSQNVGDISIRGRDLKMMAAAYLYNITGKTVYEDAVNTECALTSNNSRVAGWGWNGTSNFQLDQVWAMAGYLMTKQIVHYPALFKKMKDAITNEAKSDEANNTTIRPSRRAADNAGFWRTTQNVQRTMIAHAISTDQTEKAFLENALVLEADWGLGRNPLNMIQMTTASTPLETKRSVENMYTTGRDDGTPGVHPGQTPYTGTGNWGSGGGADPNLMSALCYPTPTSATTTGGNNNFDAIWPLAESYFNTRYCYANAEFTPQQTMRGKMALYGYLYGMNKAKTQTYILTVNATHGTIQKSPDKTNYNYGESVNITFISDNSFTFKEWSGDASGSTNPVTVDMYSNKNVNVDFNETTGVKSIGESNVTIFPNPATGSFNIKTSDNDVEVKLSIFDVNGNQLLQKVISSAEKNMNISELNHGVYFVKVITQNGTIVKKLVVMGS